VLQPFSSPWDVSWSFLKWSFIATHSETAGHFMDTARSNSSCQRYANSQGPKVSQVCHGNAPCYVPQPTGLAWLPGLTYDGWIIATKGDQNG
jgi:hypothetical protein